jgi:hypothetical protein
MSRAIFTFTDQLTNQTADKIEFDLIDNVGCRAWQYAVMLNDCSRTLFRTGPVKFHKSLPYDIEIKYKKLKQVVDKLSSTPFAYEHPVPDSFYEIDQNFMNKLHRHFTDSCAVLWYPKHADSADRTLDKILQELNNNIHELEGYLPTDHKSKYSGLQNEIWALNNGRELGYDIFPFRQYHSYEPADLILDGYILGKTLMESFACDDDPTSWDTAGHMRTNGGAIIQLTTTRQEIYNSSEFYNWLQRHGVEKYQKYADFPLGYFVAGHRSKLESLSTDLKKYSVQLHIQS